MLRPTTGLLDEIERIRAAQHLTLGVGERSWNVQTRPRTWSLSDDGGVAPALLDQGDLLTVLPQLGYLFVFCFCFVLCFFLDQCHAARNPSQCSSQIDSVAVPCVVR